MDQSLRMIRGIGQVKESQLQKQGIETVDQLSKSDHPLKERAVNYKFKCMSRRVLELINQEGCAGFEALHTGCAEPDDCKTVCKEIHSYVDRFGEEHASLHFGSGNSKPHRVTLDSGRKLMVKWVAGEQQQKTVASIERVWQLITNAKTVKERSVLIDHFVNVYALKQIGNHTVVIMESLEGDGIEFARTVKDLNLLTGAVWGLMEGWVFGLYANGVLFDDVKPANIGYTRNPDGGILFKWIDIECISEVPGSCLTVTYADPHAVLDIPDDPYASVEHTVTDNDFASELYKIGLSLLEMAFGENPIETLANKRKWRLWQTAYQITNNPQVVEAVDEAKRKLIAAGVPERMEDMLENLLDHSPAKRLSWLRQVFHLDVATS